MKGYTENRVVVFRDYDHVFDLTNDIEQWPNLFTEYKDAKVLSREGDEITFQLTTFADGQKPSRTWVSKRRLDKDNKLAIAHRIDPLFPFSYMNIRWEYEILPSDTGVIMTWIQEFDVADDCKFTLAEMESFLNRNTHKQMQAVKSAVERWECLEAAV